MDLDLGVVIAACSTLLSFVAILISRQTARSQEQLHLHVSREEQVLMFEQIRSQRDSDIIRWTERCVNLLSECESVVTHFDEVGPEHERRDLHRKLAARLSALIDQGRLYFPNQEPEAKGQEKESAYRGYRQLILTVLVRAYDRFVDVAQLHDPDARPDVAADLVSLRRLFVSEAQVAIDPRRYVAMKEMNALKAARGIDVQVGTGDSERTRSALFESLRR